jgi:NHL repeat
MWAMRLTLLLAIACTGVADAQITHTPFPKIDNVAGYKADPAWPREKPPGGEWTAAMSSVAIAPDGNIWTLNRGALPVQVYSPEGKLVTAWGQGLFKNAHTVRFDPQGGLWIIDTLAQTVRKFSQTGQVLMTLGTGGEPGEDAAHLNQPNDVAFAPNGDMAVSDGYGNDRVVLFDKHGKFLHAWGKLGQGPGEFSQPHGVAFDSKGRLYVADRNNSRVQVFDGQGKLLNQWRSIVTPWYIVINPADEVFVIGSSPMLWSESGGTYLATPPKDQVLMKFDITGKLQSMWGFPKGDKPGDLNWAHGFAIATGGAIYVADVQGKRVQKFVPVGAR